MTINEQFKLNIKAEIFEPINTVGFRIKYNPELVQFDESNLSQLFSHSVANLANDTQGELVLAFNNESSVIDDFIGSIGTLTFTTLKKGILDITVEQGEVYLNGNTPTWESIFSGINDITIDVQFGVRITLEIV